jgi:hypothetical protein
VIPRKGFFSKINNLNFSEVDSKCEKEDSNCEDCKADGHDKNGENSGTVSFPRSQKLNEKSLQC